VTRIDDSENLRLDHRGGILRIWHARPARDDVEAELLLATIDREIRRTGIHNLLFDSRDAERPTDGVQEHIWQWLGRHDVVRKVAVVMTDQERERLVRLAGAQKGVRVKVFGDEESARSWLIEV
jgi:hypothetical protein